MIIPESPSEPQQVTWTSGVRNLRPAWPKNPLSRSLEQVLELSLRTRQRSFRLIAQIDPFGSLCLASRHGPWNPGPFPPPDTVALKTFETTCPYPSPPHNHHQSLSLMPSGKSRRPTRKPKGIPQESSMDSRPDVRFLIQDNLLKFVSLILLYIPPVLTCPDRWDAVSQNSAHYEPSV